MDTNLIFLATLSVILLVVRWLAWLSLKSTNHLISRASAVASMGRPGKLFRSTRAHLGKRFPRTSSFVEARLTPRKFTGLGLTLMVLAAIYMAALLGGLIDELREADELIRMDKDINDTLDAVRTEEVVRVFAFITELANVATVVAVAGVTTGLLMALGHGYLVLPLWVVVLGSQVVTYAGKYGFGRERPEFLTEVMAATPSFPSGHATGAIAVYGFIAYVLSREAVTVRRRFEIVFWSAVLIALIGFSRMVLSLHYASDVAAGFLVGGFWLLVGFAIAELIRLRRSTQRIKAVRTWRFYTGHLNPPADLSPQNVSMAESAQARDVQSVETHDRIFKVLVRVGYGARAAVYVLVGVLALLMTPEGTRGALGELMKHPGGTTLLVVILLGFLCYSMWRFVEAVFDTDGHGRSFKGLVVRAGLMASCLIHLLLAVVMFGVIFDLNVLFSDDSGGNGSQSWVGWLMSQPAGRWAVAVIGIVVIGAGLAHLIKGYYRQYDRFLQIPPDKKRWTDPVCRTGLYARGIAFLIIGYLLILAGWSVNPDEAQGLEGALDWLRAHSYGKYLLGAMGLGLLAFAAYSALQAGFRSINPP